MDRRTVVCAERSANIPECASVQRLNQINDGSRVIAFGIEIVIDSVGSLSDDQLVTVNFSHDDAVPAAFTLIQHKPASGRVFVQIDSLEILEFIGSRVHSGTVARSMRAWQGFARFCPRH